MPLGMIIGIGIIGAVVLAVLVWRLSGLIRPASKKRPSVAVPVKDWQAIADRLEKRVNKMEAEALDLQRQLRDKDKLVEEVNVSCVGLKQKLDQEKAWREKEDALSRKEKQQERSLQEDLARTRDSLNGESSQRIKLEAELKETRRVKEELSGTGRGLSSRVLDLERQLESSLKELKQLREDNSRLRKKNEDTEWVAKSDYKQLEAELKRVRLQAEESKVN